VVRRGIRSLLADHHDFEIVGEAGDGKEGVCKARQLTPDVVLMDWCMPQMDDLEATHLLHQETPNVKVLIFSMADDRQSTLQITQSGAQGYIRKEASPEELVQAIVSVSRGEAFFSKDVAQIVLNQCVAEPAPDETRPASRLTGRETQILTVISEGLTNREIATQLSLSGRTGEAHRERVMRKLDIHSVVGLTRFAIASGFTTL